MHTNWRLKRDKKSISKSCNHSHSISFAIIALAASFSRICYLLHIRITSHRLVHRGPSHICASESSWKRKKVSSIQLHICPTFDCTLQLNSCSTFLFIHNFAKCVCWFPSAFMCLHRLPYIEKINLTCFIMHVCSPANIFTGNSMFNVHSHRQKL